MTDNGYAIPTGLLRFVSRNGRNILQQQWATYRAEALIDYNRAGPSIASSYDWKDIPLVTESNEDSTDQT